MRDPKPQNDSPEPLNADLLSPKLRRKDFFEINFVPPGRMSAGVTRPGHYGCLKVLSLRLSANEYIDMHVYVYIYGYVYIDIHMYT